MIAMRVTSNFNCTSSNHHDLHLPISVVMTDLHHHHHHQGGKDHNSTIFTTSSELQVATTTNRRHVHFEDEELDEMEDENEKTKMNKKKLVLGLHIPISKLMTDLHHHHHHQGGKGHNSTTFTTSSELQATTCRGRGDKNRQHAHFEDEELDEMEDEIEKTKMMNKKKIVPRTIKVSKQQPSVVPFWEVGNRRLVPNRSINQDTLNFRRLFSPSSYDDDDDEINNKEQLRDDDSSSHSLTQLRL